MAKKNILSISGLSKSFLGVKALDKASLEVEEGEVHGVIGENGAGKSTLMNIVFGDLQRDEGTMLFDGKEVNFKDPSEALQEGISMIHQETSLVQQFTVSENIWLGLEDNFKNKNGLLDNKARDKATQELLNDLGLDINYDAIIGQSSIAVCQLVEIARAIARDSKMIIMDEPTSSLTNSEVDALFTIIQKLSSEKVSVIYISHKMEEIFRICHTLSIYRDGRHICTKKVSEVTYDQVISMIVGRELTKMFSKEKSEIGEVLLKASNLTRYGAFKEVSFDLRKGEILGFVGLTGAGRSEVARCIFGIDKLDSGEISLDDKKITINNPATAVDHGIGMVTEDRIRWGIVAQISVRINLSIVKLRDLCSRFLGIVNKKRENEECDEIIRLMQIKISDINQRIDSLSGGNQQKVIIGRWAMMNSRILIMDEPTRGIDVGAKSEIHSLMNEFTKNGVSIILISSEMPEILAMSDRILVMREGKIVFRCDRDEANQELIGKYALGQ